MARGPAADASPPPRAAQSGWPLTSARVWSGWLRHGGLGRGGQASPECLLPWPGIICSHTPGLQKARSLRHAAPEALCVPSTRRRPAVELRSGLGPLYFLALGAKRWPWDGVCAGEDHGLGPLGPRRLQTLP